ncbi:hypothetical protein KEM09_04215 [Carboxylicivirga mesophila]|uniref:Uncharacterized protein n=1 Tax=Carboxylicivirga mesophila TaxID=1166478 RepID=A0ABS5K6K4_9BACT|nr:hypothetical protein [Carboxylicivirga mesophila]MBS2210591.1 hypothetical protein [Carboxylicivirga mesophila]
MKYWIILLMFFSLSNIYATNWWYDGYAITNDGEKIYGQIYVPPYNQTTGTWVISGIDLEGFYHRVLFKHDGSQSDYAPEMIREFGFTYKGSDYKFESTCLHYKSIIKSERIRHRFLNVVHRGNISLLRDSRILPGYVAGRSGFPEYITYYDYYLSSSDNKLIRLFSSSETEDLKMVLEQLGMNKRFLDSIGTIKVRTLADILFQYDLWLSERKEPAQLVI